MHSAFFLALVFPPGPFPKPDRNYPNWIPSLSLSFPRPCAFFCSGKEFRSPFLFCRLLVLLNVKALLFLRSPLPFLAFVGPD